MFLSKMCDLAQKAENTGRIMYSKFLNPAQRHLVNDRLSRFSEISFFGGYEDPDRSVAAFKADTWEELRYPVKAIKIVPSSKKQYSHRDYLGSLLGLGITRELIGDIIITEKGAVVAVAEEIADFIMMNLSRVASATVKLSVTEDLGIYARENRFKETSATVSSLRLDCVLSAVANKSRLNSASCISEGIVSVNYEIVKNTSHQIKNGDVISLKGFGKAIVETEGNLTKKGRIHISIKKYV